MSEKKNKRTAEVSKEETGGAESEGRELTFEAANAVTVSSAGVAPEAGYVDEWVAPEETEEIAGDDERTGEIEETEEIDPIFRELSEPKLPDLPRENRARLQMQSPTRLYFYWSVRNNPFQTLRRAFGGNTGSYTLVVRLLNTTRGTEELYAVEPEGNWWFNADADCAYRAEVGFYAPNRPFVRVMFSNEVRTPRRTPSWRTDYTPSFSVRAHEFAEVLDAAGYRRDAFDVAIAGDDEKQADEATHKTYDTLFGGGSDDFRSESGDEMRFALLALAAGYTLEDIREEIGEGLYRKLKAVLGRQSADDVLDALKDNFDILTDEIFEEEEIGEAVVGLSLVHFPRRVRKRNVPKTLLPKLSEMDLEELRRASMPGSAGLPVGSSSHLM